MAHSFTMQATAGTIYVLEYNEQNEIVAAANVDDENLLDTFDRLDDLDTLDPEWHENQEWARTQQWGYPLTREELS